MTNYWTEDVLPPLPSPQRVLLRGGVAMVSLLGVGFGLGWVAAPQRADAPCATQTCSAPTGTCELRAVAVEVPVAAEDRPTKIGNEPPDVESVLEPKVPMTKTVPVEPDAQFK